MRAAERGKLILRPNRQRRSPALRHEVEEREGRDVRVLSSCLLVQHPAEDIPVNAVVRARYAARGPMVTDGTPSVSGDVFCGKQWGRGMDILTGWCSGDLAFDKSRWRERKRLTLSRGKTLIQRTA